MVIRPARAEDAAAIWSIIGTTIRAGETYALDPQMSEGAALAYWMGADKDPFVAEEDGAIVGHIGHGNLSSVGQLSFVVFVASLPSVRR